MYPSHPPIETPMSPNRKLATTAPMMPRMMFTITPLLLFMTIEAIQPANPPIKMAAIHPTPSVDAGRASLAGIGTVADDGGELGDGPGAGCVADVVGAWAVTTGAVGAVAVECREVTVSPGACRVADAVGVVGPVAVERREVTVSPRAGCVADAVGVVGPVAVDGGEVAAGRGASGVADLVGAGAATTGAASTAVDVDDVAGGAAVGELTGAVGTGEASTDWVGAAWGGGREVGDGLGRGGVAGLAGADATTGGLAAVAVDRGALAGAVEADKL